MPLVTPQSTENQNPKDVWTDKLVGKTLHDDETNETAFCKKELPEKHRVIAPGTKVTRDFFADRLNVHVDDQGIVNSVTYG
ncbi:hypothetical protein ACRE_045780 [Hapsidospora chrysogenum ATCC 11550]|uniref:Proteinase inhibitor I78 n=1 Tax=Hapsidospora chrysogenum (strain ATCC 11550 / CBS 779.69 / DSM 880 / IAM 14645 / JCM 23072 / IMI 49137) TaxID=857340 RepID=A0A086T5K6_HAPC1|nr:hypothetical protein ACRE_045780 [Hapsidospora chrysogenum ATCC 11550]